MDPDRAPQSIRDFIAALICPVCETPKKLGIIVKVSFQQPNLYVVQAHCLKCEQFFGWNFSGPPPEPAPAPVIQTKAAERTVADVVPLPPWVRDLGA